MPEAWTIRFRRLDSPASPVAIQKSCHVCASVRRANGAALPVRFHPGRTDILYTSFVKPAGNGAVGKRKIGRMDERELQHLDESGYECSGELIFRKEAAPPNAHARFAKPGEFPNLEPRRQGWQCATCGHFDEFSCSDTTLMEP